ncbi:hypothetical protein EV13_2417 [Prochlorococcus sp. MIT 0702]|nr:hypothetical protein EV13_2417 [Prochlorococcus sp. MIT 0702]KGG29385.1 hypothetical protein EV12_0167 [Prochlorococcus sp. MIT 0701]KGG33686.1 hypothetical protein EV14_1575 [Prochlorococcus sp. MIT 0703]
MRVRLRLRSASECSEVLPSKITNAAESARGNTKPAVVF